MIFTCIALEIYGEKNFDLSHTLHRVKKMNMKNVHKLRYLYFGIHTKNTNMGRPSNEHSLVPFG